MRGYKFLGCVIVLILGITSAQLASEDKDFEGIWMGVLEVQGGMELRIIFKIKKEPDGTYKAMMDSPDQGTKGIFVNTVNPDGDKIAMECKNIGGLYEGNIAKDGSQIDGTWKQSGMSFPLVLKRIEKVPDDRRAQDPRKPYPYIEEEVIFENKKSGIKLAGTLTLPQAEGSFSAVLLITGSGPQDRNETVFGHRPFLVLADYLTRRNLAVLRVDDRGVGGSTGDMAMATSEDFVEDVLAGVAYLKGRKEINAKKIGLIGHSEGGIIAPMAAVQSPDMAFIVLMAGPGLIGEEILYLQGALIARAQGVSEEEIKKNTERQKRYFTVLKEEEDNAVAEETLKRLMAEDMAAQLPEDEKERQAVEEVMNAQIEQLLSPWFRFFLTYDPLPALKNVKCPVLAIIGEKDLQVPPKENLAAIEKALRAGENTDFTVREIPGLNHLFQTAETGAPGEYVKIEETFSPTALKIIGDWIQVHTEDPQKKIILPSIQPSTFVPYKATGSFFALDWYCICNSILKTVEKGEYKDENYENARPGYTLVFFQRVDATFQPNSVPGLITGSSRRSGRRFRLENTLSKKE